MGRPYIQNPRLNRRRRRPSAPRTLSLDELRERMPELRARETSLRHQRDALDVQLADREVYL
jgi:hypothetical protein